MRPRSRTRVSPKGPRAGSDVSSGPMSPGNDLSLFGGRHMRMRNFTLFCGLLLLVGAVAPSVALGHTSKAAYDWHVGDALLQSIGFPVGNQAMAPNGDVVTIVGTGSFSADGKWATGGGTFSHHVAASGE